MLKNPFKFLNGAKRKKRQEPRREQLLCTGDKNNPNEEDLDVATEALEDLFITSDLTMDVHIQDDDVQSQLSDASTVALSSTASNVSQIDQTGCEFKLPSR